VTSKSSSASSLGLFSNGTSRTTSSSNIGEGAGENALADTMKASTTDEEAHLPLEEAPPTAMLDDVLENTVRDINEDKKAQRRKRADALYEATSGTSSIGPVSSLLKTPKGRKSIATLDGEAGTTPGSAKGRLPRQLKMLEELREEFKAGQSP
jgi:hypothetical protein